MIRMVLIIESCDKQLNDTNKRSFNFNSKNILQCGILPEKLFDFNCSLPGCKHFYFVKTSANQKQIIH